MKKCWVCKEQKEKTEFYKDSRQPDLLQKACKLCQKERAKKYNKENKKYFSKKGSERYQKAIKDNPDYNQERYRKDKAKFLERRKRYSASVRGKLSQLLLSAKMRSAKKGIEFDLDLDYMYKLFDAQNGKCALTGLDFTYKAGHTKETGKKFNPFNPSLDKINPERGYTKDNVRLVLVIINLSLNTFGDNVFDEISRAYISKKYSIDIKPNSL